MIDRLQNYYGISIHRNKGDIVGMKKAIYASVFHVASSKTNCWHDHCPTGKDSWCGYQADLANGTKHYVPGAGLPTGITCKHVKPIFEELSSDELLSKCLHGHTQNQNESVNGTVWNRLPKYTYVGLRQFEIGIYDAVSNFNIGNLSVIKTFEKLDIDPGIYTIQCCLDANKFKLDNSQRQSSIKKKNRRRYIRGIKQTKGDKTKLQEGETYCPGGF